MAIVYFTIQDREYFSNLFNNQAIPSILKNKNFQTGGFFASSFLGKVLASLWKYNCFLLQYYTLDECNYNQQSSEAEDDQHTQVCELEIENISFTVFILWGSAGASSCLKSGAWYW